MPLFAGSLDIFTSPGGIYPEFLATLHSIPAMVVSPPSTKKRQPARCTRCPNRPLRSHCEHSKAGRAFLAEEARKAAFMRPMPSALVPASVATNESAESPSLPLSPNLPPDTASSQLPPSSPIASPLSTPCPVTRHGSFHEIGMSAIEPGLRPLPQVNLVSTQLPPSSPPMASPPSTPFPVTPFHEIGTATIEPGLPLLPQLNLSAPISETPVVSCFIVSWPSLTSVLGPRVMMTALQILLVHPANASRSTIRFMATSRVPSMGIFLIVR